MASKNITIISVVVVIAALVLVLFLLYPKLYNAQPTTITTQGLAETKVLPDSVVVYLYTQIVNKSAEDAKNKNAEVMEKVVTALKTIGFDESEIQTEQFNIYPNYNWDNGKQELTGYTATQNVKIETSDFEKIGKVVDFAVDSGALISYINFELSTAKQNEIKARLLSDASKDARVKADSIANGLGKKVVDVVSVSAGDYNYYPYPIYRAEASDMAGSAVKEAVASTDITPKQLDISSQVSVTFKIE